MTALAMQDVLLWTQNKTAEYIDAHSPDDRKRIIQNATKKRRDIVKIYQEKINSIKAERKKEVEHRNKAREAKERQLITQTISNTDNALQICR